MIEHVLVGVALIAGLAGGYFLARSRRNGRRGDQPDAVHRILLPFTGTEISRRAVDAALRLARAEDATLMPAYLALVPKSLPLECAIPNEAGQAMPMLEAIEQRATAQGVPVDARIERGRSYQHALSRRARPERPGSPPTIWSGCWRRPRPRCSSSSPVPRTAGSSASPARPPRSARAARSAAPR
jgi:nucleotide-binding universal stress UspA family protein